MGFLDQVHCTPLTPHIMLAILPDNVARHTVINTLTALRHGVAHLLSFYDSLQKLEVSLPKRQKVSRHPALSLPAPWPFWMDPPETLGTQTSYMGR